MQTDREKFLQEMQTANEHPVILPNMSILHRGNWIIQDVAAKAFEFVTIIDSQEVECFVYSPHAFTTQDPDA